MSIPLYPVFKKIYPVEAKKFHVKNFTPSLSQREGAGG
jgi:hypothetical protein